MHRNKFENKCRLEEFENASKKRKKALIFDCNNCSIPHNEQNFTIDSTCFQCFLFNFYRFRRKDLNNAIFKRKKKLIISKDKLKNFNDYFNRLPEIENNLKKTTSIFDRCIYKKFGCTDFPNISNYLKNYKKYILNPFLLSKKGLQLGTNPIESRRKDPICIACHSEIKKILKKLDLISSKLKILDLYKKKMKFIENQASNTNLGNFLFVKGPNLSFNKFKQKNRINHKGNFLEEYRIGFIPLFIARIYQLPKQKEFFYEFDVIWDSNHKKKYSDKIANFIMKKLQSIEINDIYSLESLIKFYQEKCVEILTLNYDFDKDLIIKVSFYSTLRFLNLLKLFPLLHDDYIEEIFLDSPSNYIYLNHRNYGRCRTNIFFTNNDIERVKTLIRIYSQKRIDFNNPSLKFVLKNKYFNCRFSIDIKPIHPENFALTIRKFNNKIFTIQNLLKNGTLDPLIASFLFFCMIYRINITVIGETDSGKTTFVNALDLITPKYFRKIYVENISESLDQKEFGKHQLKYRVDSVSLTNNEVLTKSAQIRSLLHKTPDLIYLGEILTKEESEAMFHCLAAGLTGFQTIHAKSVESFINRVLYHFKINRACLNDLGVLILMRKDINLKRRVLSINEIIGVNEENEKYYREIFTYNPKLEKWFLKYDLYKTSIVQGLKNSEDFNFSKFWGLIRYYYTFFLKVSKSNLISKNFLVELFNQLSQKTFLSEKTFFTNN